MGQISDNNHNDDSNFQHECWVCAFVAQVLSSVLHGVGLTWASVSCMRAAGSSSSICSRQSSKHWLSLLKLSPKTWQKLSEGGLAAATEEEDGPAADAAAVASPVMDTAGLGYIQCRNEEQSMVTGVIAGASVIRSSPD